MRAAALPQPEDDELSEKNRRDDIIGIQKSQKYDAAQIDKLEGLEAVRKRPGMYIGDPDERGLHHCVFEVLDNSIDEHLAGYCTKIDVTVHVDGSVSVRDNGRGIPVDMHPKFKMPAVELVLTNLHAGGKFGQGAYKYSGGLHGVGAKCVNALSDWFKVEVSRDGKVYHMAFERGKTTREAERHRRAEEQEEHRHADHVPARSDDLHDHDRVQVRAAGDAFARTGVPESRAWRSPSPTSAASRRRRRTFLYKHGIEEFVKQLGENKTGHPSQADRDLAAARRSVSSMSSCNTTTATTTRFSASRIRFRIRTAART